MNTADHGGAATATNAATDTAPSELEAAKALAEENHKKFLYAMADFENYKKRIERQFGEIAMSGKKALLLKFLPVLDNLERALSSQSEGEALREGLNNTLKGFEAVLQSEGVSAMVLIGEKFDPRRAEAISTQPSETHPADTVVDVAIKGYTLNDDVLRPAQVVVTPS